VVLAEKTFAQRIQPYISQLAEQKFIRYGGAEFWENGWVSKLADYRQMQ
jgi:hypothetical protein